ncbi:hypothetical protein AURDEDRAFT_144634 [Auricularia subglabra TFB-10046 SS5]|nr:hypothetical protein AURDEDRAFT_144634 [Auricularia subglabra TFB-10046 SS5]
MGIKSAHVLSVFDRALGAWAKVPLRPPLAPTLPSPWLGAGPSLPHDQKISLVSWNLHAASPWPVERSAPIIRRFLHAAKPSDIVFLQEVAPSVRDALLADPRVRAGFFAADTDDGRPHRGVHCASMTLLSTERFVAPLQRWDAGRMQLAAVFRVPLPGRVSRDALGVDVRAAPGAVFRLLNVDLEPCDSPSRRESALRDLGALLREPACAGGVVAGDFNANDPDDRALVQEHGLVDAWDGEAGAGVTWGRWGMHDERELGDDRREERLAPGRHDKVALLAAEPLEMQVMQPGRVRQGGGMYWSDHCGIRCSFVV